MKFNKVVGSWGGSKRKTMREFGVMMLLFYISITIVFTRLYLSKHSKKAYYYTCYINKTDLNSLNITFQDFLSWEHKNPIR